MRAPTLVVLRTGEQTNRLPPGASPPQQVAATGTTVGTGTVPDGALLRDASSTTTGAGGAEVIGGDEAVAASDAYPHNGAIESTGRGASAVAGGDVISTARIAVADTAGPAEDVMCGSFVNGYAIGSRRWIGDFDGEDPAAPATDGICIDPGARPLVLIAASHYRNPPLDPYASGSAAHS